MTLGEHHVEKIILAEPRGFCAGVDRAVEAVRSALRTYGRPLYVRHQIVHNRFVLEALVEEGAIFVEELGEVPEGQRVIFSAHGVAPSEWERARDRGLRVIDATCPLVTKVHLEVERYAREDRSVILVGHADHAQRGRHARDHGDAQAASPGDGRAQDRRYLLRDPEPPKRGQGTGRAEGR